MILITFISTLVLGFSAAQGQILVDDPTDGQSQSQSAQPTRVKTGEKAARKYFTEREPSKPSAARSQSNFESSSQRYLSVHLGSFINDKQYRWGTNNEDDVGDLFLGVTYRVGEWVNSMDLLFRADLETYDIDGKNPTKLSLMPIVAFPDAASGFPLYFGGGAGIGVFFSQIGSESDLSFDYQLLTGLRFPQLFETGGLVFEIGYKGHVLLFSSGQFSGVYASLGGVFEF